MLMLSNLRGLCISCRPLFNQSHLHCLQIVLATCSQLRYQRWAAQWRQSIISTFESKAKNNHFHIKTLNWTEGGEEKQDTVEQFLFICTSESKIKEEKEAFWRSQEYRRMVFISGNVKTLVMTHSLSDKPKGNSFICLGWSGLWRVT
jgi:hypothetical protein